jgi:hypothetical protein
MHYMASQAVCEHDYNRLHNSHLDLQDCIHHPIAFFSKRMGDIMYLHQALRQPDAREFVEAVIKEVNGHIDNDHWKLIPSTKVPEGTEVIPLVWAMQRKQDLRTGRVTKHKARLNLHSGKQEFGTNYYKTYAPVVTWFAIRLLIVFGILFNWALRQVDFVMAYPQAPIKMDMYMKLPTGIHTKHGNSNDHFLKLLANIYGQKQAGHVWNSYFVTKLREIIFKQSLIDDCIFTWITLFSLSTLTMESSWDHRTNSYVTSSTSYITSSCPLKIKATRLIMLELVSRNSRTASSN